MVQHTTVPVLLDGVPCSVLGYPITTRTQICLTCCLTAVLELLVYLIVVVADVAVIVQHWRDEQPLFAGLTTIWLVLPAFVCFVTVLTSPWQWPNDDDNDANDANGGTRDVAACYCGRTQMLFVGRQMFNLCFFPIGAVYR